MYLCDVNISCHSLDNLLSVSGPPKLVVTVNAEAIVRAQTDNRLKSIINENCSTIDGQIPLWLYKLKYRNMSIDKISGSDLIYTLPGYAEKKGYRVFLLGGKEDSNKGAVMNLKELFPKLDIDGFSPEFRPYPFPDFINNQIIGRIKEFRPDILFVGFGMGKQEFWENDYYSELEELGVKLIIGCGGSFDFASGKIKRAPRFVQKVGLEGIWRRLREFKWFRIKRILLSTKVFYYYLLDLKNSDSVFVK